MFDAAYFRKKAADCRRASKLGRRPALYLVDLAEHYDRLAAQLDARFAGNKPGALRTRDTEMEKPRR